MMGKIINIFQDESGVSAAEYGLMLLMLTTIMVAVVELLGTSISNLLTSIANQLGS